MKQHPIKYLRSFGFKLWLYQGLILILNKFNIFPNFKKILMIKKQQQILKILKARYSNVIDRYKAYEATNKPISNKIWIMWWQGIENAPSIVKKCIESIKTKCQDKEIILLSKDNIKSYLDIPDNINNKVNSKAITLTHLSDYIRVNLLKQYGGFWIDSTIFMTDSPFLSGDFRQFSTIRFENTDKTSLSDGKWCGFFLGGQNQELYDYMVDFLNTYWENETLLIDYFLIDYIIKIIYDMNSTVREKFDTVEYNNQNIHELQRNLNNKYDSLKFNEILKSNKVHKLSFKEKIVDEPDTFYSVIFK